VTNIANLAETAIEFGKDAKDSIDRLAKSAEKLLQSASEALDDKRGNTGDVLHGAAKSIKNKGRQSADALTDFTDSAADKLHATAKYIENTNFRGMARNFARRTPALSLAIAAAVGFFLASALMRRRA